MVDTVANLNEKKSKIMSLIKLKGPCLPVQLSREIGLSILFTSAILSEMASDKSLKISNLKVGGSPLYFLPSQEAMLEKFSNHLPLMEKEAFELLKKKSLLDDEKIQPAHRVALRNIKDFAIPMKATTEKGERIFWRIYSFPKERAIEEIRRLVYKTKSKPADDKGKQEQKESREDDEKKESIKRGKEDKKKEKAKETGFAKRVYNYLQTNKIELLEEKELKKRNIMLRVNVNSDIGRFEMLVIAKDKKTVSDSDLKLALSQGQSSKLPVLLLATGKLSKKAVKETENFKSYLIFKELA